MGVEIKISIIIPVYNTEVYLRRCMDSVCGQTLRELQIICVDDGSTDGSLCILEEYAKRDSRVQILHHEHTGNGAGGVRNMGLRYAVGEYVLLLDSDDYFELDLAEKTYIKAKTVDADIVLFDARIISDNEKPKSASIIVDRMIPEKEVFSREDCKKTIFQITSGMAWSRLWRRKFIEENRIRFLDIKLYEDGFFSYTAMAMAKKIVVLREKLVNYRLFRENSLTSGLDANPYYSKVFFEMLKKYLVENNIYGDLQESYCQLMFSHYMAKLKKIDTYENFEKIYYALQNGAIKEVADFYESVIDREGMLNNVIVKRKMIVDDIHKLEPERFLFKRFCELDSNIIIFPEKLVSKNENIVLYGAGVIGKNFFMQNMAYRYCNIVGWIDRDYERKGYPICSPKDILHMIFDKVIIAIEDENIANNIRMDLIKLGVNEDKILWQYPYEYIIDTDNAIDLGKSFMFWANNYNGLFEMEKSSGEVKRVTGLPGYGIYEENMFVALVKARDYIVLGSKTGALKIAAYNCKTTEWRIFDLKDNPLGNKYTESVFGFIECLYYDKYVYVIGHMVPLIIQLDLDTLNIKYIMEWMQDIDLSSIPEKIESNFWTISGLQKYYIPNIFFTKGG